MFAKLMLLNKLGSVDVGFFVGCAVAIVLIVAIYFLIPVFNKKQYQEQRDNLKKREEAFKTSKGLSNTQDGALFSECDVVSALDAEEAKTDAEQTDVQIENSQDGDVQVENAKNEDGQNENPQDESVQDENSQVESNDGVEKE